MLFGTVGVNGTSIMWKVNILIQEGLTDVQNSFYEMYGVKLSVRSHSIQGTCTYREGLNRAAQKSMTATLRVFCSLDVQKELSIRTIGRKTEIL